MILPKFDLKAAQELLGEGIEDESVLDRYGRLIEAATDASLAGREVTSGAGGSTAGARGTPGPEGVDQVAGAGYRDQRGYGAQADPAPAGAGQTRAGHVRDVRRPSPATDALSRARRLSAEGRRLLDHLLRDSAAQDVVREVAWDLGLDVPDQDGEYAILADLLQYASWAAAAHVARRFEIERAREFPA